MNLPEIIEANEAYFNRKCCCATHSPFPLVLPPVVSRQPLSSKDLAEEGVAAWLPFGFSG